MAVVVSESMKGSLESGVGKVDIVCIWLLLLELPNLDKLQGVKFSGQMNCNQRSSCHWLQSSPVPVFFQFMRLDFQTLLMVQMEGTL